MLCVLVGASAVPIGPGKTDNSGQGEPWSWATNGETETGENSRDNSGW